MMRDPDYYRDQAARARRLAAAQHSREIYELLQQLARDFDDIVVDLETGAIDIRHPEMMPQTRRANTK